jgi:hypothetical protein
MNDVLLPNEQLFLQIPVALAATIPEGIIAKKKAAKSNFRSDDQKIGGRRKIETTKAHTSFCTCFCDSQTRNKRLAGMHDKYGLGAAPSTLVTPLLALRD